MTDVLQVVADTGRRGAQMFARDLHVALEHSGRSVHTVALAAGNAPGVLPFDELGGRRLGPTSLVRLRQLMRRASVVIAHGSSTLPACTVAGAGLHTPFVYRSIGDPLYWANTRLRRARVRVAQSRAAAIVALWPGAAHTLRTRLRVPPDRVHVIPNAASTSAFHPPSHADRIAARRAFGISSSDVVVGYIGALSEEKRVDRALDATADLRDVTVLVAGVGPCLTDLERHTAAIGHGRVQFIGCVTDPRQLYAAVDVIVLLSDSEGLPGVLIEAGLMAIPCVATDVGGVSEIVVPGLTGELVAAVDAATHAPAVARALEHRHAYGKAARVHCEDRFAIRRVADQYADLLDTVVGQVPAAGRKHVQQAAPAPTADVEM